jgi:hypothetical protein
MPNQPRPTDPIDIAPLDTAPINPDHVDLSNPGELEYWTEEFGITADHLRQIVGRRGTDVVELRAMLEK